MVDVSIVETQCFDVSPFCSQSTMHIYNAMAAQVVVRSDLADVSTSRRFVHNLHVYVHHNGRASDHKVLPCNQLNTRFLRPCLGVFTYTKFARLN